jgi:hypothetical protein
MTSPRCTRGGVLTAGDGGLSMLGNLSAPIPTRMESHPTISRWTSCFFRATCTFRVFVDRS